LQISGDVVTRWFIKFRETLILFGVKVICGTLVLTIVSRVEHRVTNQREMESCGYDSGV
jgi:hypothetical protein